MPESVSLVGYAIALLSMVAGAAGQVAIGMGLNLFSIPILALVDPALVPGPVLLASGVLTAWSGYQMRAHMVAAEFRASVVGLVLGTAIAAAFLATTDTAHLPRLFGALVVLAAGLTAAGLHVPLTAARVFSAGTLAGMMGTVAGMHAPPLALLYQRETPARIRSAMLPFLAAANFISLVALFAIGLLGWPQVKAALFLAPGVLVGYWLAPLLIRVLSPRAIRIAILAISAASGLALVIKG